MRNPVPAIARLLRRVLQPTSAGRVSGAALPLNPDAPTRLLVIANAVIPTVQLALVQPLRTLMDAGQVSIEFLTEEQLKQQFGKRLRAPEAGGAWFGQRLAESRATCLFLCRYSGPFAREAIDFARARGIPSIYCIDDDLLNVPREIGAAKFEYHNHPLRLDAVRFLLENADLVYCSNRWLAARIERLGIRRQLYVGKLFCAGAVIAPPRRRTAMTMGYMGFDHAHDFEVALPAVVRAMRKNPRLRFELFGKIARPPQLEEFGTRVIQLPVVADYDAFLKALAAREWDIGICPLARTPFNEVKNINKWIEYTSVGTAVVASRGMIYDVCCSDGCGWLADDGDWDEALQALIADPGLRLRQVQAAQRRLEQNYSLEALRTQLLEVMERASRALESCLLVSNEAPLGHVNEISTKEVIMKSEEKLTCEGMAPSDPVSKVIAKEREQASVAFDGFTETQVYSGYVELLSNEDLKRLNELLPWMCFTADTMGRRFGNIAWKGKRETPQIVPDPRIEQMDEAFGLKGRSVLEVGGFEGVHTIALAQYGAEVTAVDSRIENVVKTVVRGNLFGHKPTCFVSDIEKADDMERLPHVDFVHHIGVLYHLKDPVTHLKRLAAHTRSGFLLDTHYAKPYMLNNAYYVDGREYRYFHYREKGRDELFSGMYDHAKWLLLDDLKTLLSDLGFSTFQMLKDEQQRNGPRFTALISR